MNQKQRDILCGMLKKEADKLQAQLSKQFPLQDFRSHGILAVSSLGIYETRHLTERAIVTLSPSCVKKHARLVEKEKCLEKQNDALRNEWKSLVDIVNIKRAENKALFDNAAESLKDAVQNAVIKIQFAENAEEAQKILSSLPSIESLLFHADIGD